jgi:hypothetical protein
MVAFRRQQHYYVAMRKAQTLGFAVDPEDRPRLDHLADVFGSGNRSEFLRRAMVVMERLESAQRLTQLQAYGEHQLAASGRTHADIPEIVSKVLANPDPAALAEAKLLVAAIRERPRVQRPSSDRELTEAEVVFRSIRSESGPL